MKLQLFNTQESGRRMVVLLAAVVLLLFVSVSSALAQPPEPAQDKISINADGVVHVPAQDVPVSSLLSPEGKKYMADHLRFMLDPEAQVQVEGLPRYMKTYLDRQRVLYPVDRQDTKVAGVHAYVYTPKEGISAANKDRVLINLHGGGFSGCWPGCAELESIPIAGSGRIKVVSVDYREGPDYKFPAASEDVASVYKELLKTHKPQNIGIFGCSAGGMLTAMAIAWFDKEKLPMPGGIGIFCAGAGGGGMGGGDGAYTATPLGEMRMARAMPPGGRGAAPGRGEAAGRGAAVGRGEAAGRGAAPGRGGYLGGTDPNDPLVSPVNSPQLLAKFPPTLLITATRGMELSGVITSHAQLVKAGADARLNVFEGMFHCFYYNPDVPESKDAYSLIVKYFERQLGKK
jgi:epsilon-lactone hydrolase